MTATPIDFVALFAMIGVCAVAFIGLLIALMLLGCAIEVLCMFIWLGIFSVKFVVKRIAKLVRLLT